MRIPFLLAKTDKTSVSLPAVDLAQGGLQLEPDTTSKETKTCHSRDQAKLLRRDWGCGASGVWRAGTRGKMGGTLAQEQRLAQAPQ